MRDYWTLKITVETDGHLNDFLINDKQNACQSIDLLAQTKFLLTQNLYSLKIVTQLFSVSFEYTNADVNNKC